jgi:serine/threonine protein kinase/Skp family chaperone for outer membrane proteins
VSDQSASNQLDVTLAEFVSGQKLFNRYTLIRALGRGGMGVVWLARDDQLDRDVALKFVPQLIVLDPAVLSELKRETKRSLELTHKNIVRIHDFVHVASLACISMEYVDGGTLSSLRVQKENKIFEPAEIADWVGQLCDALDYAHKHARIVHRDLKPSNVMVNQRGDLKVADFGIARSLADSVSMLTQTRGTSGTLVYMSPQQLDGERGTHLDDVYSFGATIYELITSKPPFFSGNIDRQIHEKVPPSMTERRKDLEVDGKPIPLVWEQVIASCLAKDPTRRPQSMADVSRRLAQGLSEPAGAIPMGSEKKKKARVIGLGAVATLLVLGLFAYFLRSTSSKKPQSPPEVLQQPSQPATPKVVPVPSATQPPVVVSEPTRAEQPKPNRPPSTSYYAGLDPSFAFVDMNIIFKAYNKTKEAEAKINEAKNAAKKEYDDRSDSYKKALDQINTMNKQLDGPGLSADTKTRLAKDRDGKIANIKNMEREITEFRQTREKQLQEQALKLREGIVAEITAKIRNLGATDNVIIDRSGNSLNGVPLFIYSPEKANMSQRVIAALNQSEDSPFVPTNGLELGLVDMNKTFKNYNKTKDAEARVNESKNAAKKEYDDRAGNYKKALDEITRLNKQLDSQGLSADTKTRLAKDRDDKIANIKNMEREITEFRQTRERQLQEQALRMREGIVAEITKVITDRLVNKLDGVVIDISGTSLNGVPIALYTNNIPDFSEEVIEALNQGGGTGSILPADKPFAHSKTLRIGKIDMDRAFKSLPETKQAEAEINAAKEQAKRDFAANSDAKAKEAKDKEIQDSATKSRNVIVDKIKAVVTPAAKKGTFNLIFDSSGNSLNGVPVLVTSRDIPDLTDEVVAQVQAR